MKRQKLLAMVETAVMTALSLVLNLIVVYKLPQGGSVTLGAMVPILLMSLRRGIVYGSLTGMLSGGLQFVMSGQAFHPLSILLDYVLAYGLVGIFGFLKGSAWKVTLGTVLSCFLRFCCHLISGATLFAAYAPVGQNPWIYSLSYNASYMIPECLVSILLLSLLYRYAKKLFA